MKKFSLVVSLAIALALVSGAAFAAGATSPSTAKKPSLLSRIMHHGKKATSTSTSIGSGQIIGDKNTKVYHLPGDKYALPAEKNRVYFKTVAEAQAAGYHHAGSKSASTAGTRKSSKKTMHAKSTGKGHMSMKKGKS